jgi:hypothetical protein
MRKTRAQTKGLKIHLQFGSRIAIRDDGDDIIDFTKLQRAC